MAECIFIYVTVETEVEAEKIGRALVEERLAACINIIPGMRSIYRWQGKLEQGNEVVLIAKSQAALFETIVQRVKAMHSAEIPCIVAMPIVQGAADFLDWIGQNVAQNPA